MYDGWIDKRSGRWGYIYGRHEEKEKVDAQGSRSTALGSLTLLALIPKKLFETARQLHKRLDYSLQVMKNILLIDMSNRRCFVKTADSLEDLAEDLPSWPNLQLLMNSWSLLRNIQFTKYVL